ncbi:MAG: IS630 family transposase [Planctomycetes bacterium]|nr:IS630 family transposase [Planctomycetota bacterium]
MQPHRQVAWVIPPDHSGEYVSCMEDVLAVYERPYDPAAPVVCMDEQPMQRVKETRQPIPAAAGRPARVDYEYERNGTAAIFMFTEPKAGWRRVTVREQRTKLDWAYEVRELLDGRYAGVPKLTLVMDNLNTHTAGSLYEAFPPAEARRLAQRLEIHYTPKHGSWLNIAENELSALTRQCLARRIGTLQQMRTHVNAWRKGRNHAGARVNWRFTIDRARERLRRVYPQL